jgi:DNA-binding protein
MTTLLILFYNTEVIQVIAGTPGTKNILAYVLAFISFNALVETSVCFILGTAVSKALDIFARRSGIRA